jgi:hypothetical protein
MDWIPALLKHLAISRSAIGALFITSVTLYAGPRIAPTYIDPVPREWMPVLVAFLVFTACLLLFWGCSSVWGLAKCRWVATSAFIASCQLDQLEADALLALGDYPSESLNLERVNYERLQLSRLEVMELMNGLEKKGLVSFNPYSSNLVALTPTGRQRALEIQRGVERKAT